MANTLGSFTKLDTGAILDAAARACLLALR